MSNAWEMKAVSDCEVDERQDSGIETTLDGELDAIEQKIDKLSDMIMEQCRLLNTMKEEISKSHVFVSQAYSDQNETIRELLKNTTRQSPEPAENSRAKCLLDAIEGRKGAVDREIRELLTSFLQSEDLKERIVQTTATSVREVIDSCLSRDISVLYLPILQQAQRRLRRHVTKVVEDAFVELEDFTRYLYKCQSKMSRSLAQDLERHRALLEAAAVPRKDLVDTLKCTIEELLSKELKEWSQKMQDIFKSPNLDFTATTDNTMTVEMVEISKQIDRGDVNGAFDRALSASDLSLVMWACRRAAWGSAPGPRCQLRQNLLMALMQQLSTDMAHDTQLKCRYLEEAIIHLDARNPETRQHLPLVVGEVHKHLSAFLTTWPGHVASGRVKLIILAADNLLL